MSLDRTATDLEARRDDDGEAERIMAAYKAAHDGRLPETVEALANWAQSADRLALHDAGLGH